MATSKSEHLQNVQSIHHELIELLDGMDYCLDWKPDTSAWSARDLVYHLVDTPPGGIHGVVAGILSGQLAEFDLWSDRNNMTPERLTNDMEQVRQDVLVVLDRLENSLDGATEEELSQKSAMVHQRNRGWDEPRTAENLLLGLFARHWQEHLEQLRELRQALGM